MFWSFIISNGDIDPKDAIKAFSTNETIIKNFRLTKDKVKAAYLQNPQSICEAPPSIVLKLVEERIIPPEIAIQTFPTNKALVTACYEEDSESIRFASIECIIALIEDDTIWPQHAIKAFPENQDIISCAIKTDLSSIKYVSPTLVLDLMKLDSIEPKALARAFPSNSDIVIAAYQCDPSSIIEASPSTISMLIGKGTIDPHQGISHFSENKDIILAAYKKEPSSIKNANVLSVFSLLSQGLVLPEYVLPAYPSDKAIILSSYKNNPKSIQYASVTAIIELIDNGYIDPNDAVKAFPDNATIIKKSRLTQDEVNASYLQNPQSICEAPPSIVLKLVEEQIIPPEIAIQTFPKNKSIVTACYAKNPASIKHVSISYIIELIENKSILPQDAVKAFPDNKDIIIAAMAKDAYSVKYASPVFVLDGIKTGLINTKAAVKVFSSNLDIISVAYQYNPSSIADASPSTITMLIKKGTIAPHHGIAYFPENKDIILAAYKKEPICIKNVPIKTLLKLMDNDIVSPKDVVAQFHHNKETISAAYQKDPSSIKNASPTLILELLEDGIILAQDIIQLKLIENGLITPQNAVIAFPNNKDLIRIADHHQFKIHQVESVKSQAELIALIHNDKADPKIAIQQNPKDKKIIEAAYKKDPSSIQYADKETINELGRINIIQENDVLSLFSITMPTSAQLLETKNQFQSALSNKNWTTIARICDTFWFEKPLEANKETVITSLIHNKEWEGVSQLEQFFNKEEHQLTFGPLIKAPETFQLEQLTRKMMSNDDFHVQSFSGDDHFVFKDGTTFNWTKIRAQADLQHIDLNKDDLNSYRIFMDSGQSIIKSTLIEANTDDYRTKIYTNPLTKTPFTPPEEDLISFQEMQAINIYTLEYYSHINGLMRDDIKSFDYRIKTPTEIRSALVQSVFAASGLRKIPQTTIPVAYRGAGLISEKDLADSIKAATQKGVRQMEGFVSTSIDRQLAFIDTTIFYELNNLRGAYIAPISRYGDREKEFLIPQTQVQFTKYQLVNGQHTFHASLVAEVGLSRSGEYTPTEKPQTEDSILKWANPEAVIALVEKGDIPPEQALQAFPNHAEYILRASEKNSGKDIPRQQEHKKSVTNFKKALLDIKGEEKESEPKDPTFSTKI